jgi:fatty acid desaturase
LSSSLAKTKLMATELARSPLSLNSPEFLRRVNELRRTDNVTGWLYLVREYLLMAVVLGGTIGFYHWLEVAGHSWLWAVPVTLVVIFLVGACQHRLVTLTHEASHYMLFRNRLLNELVSEWFCMYPVLGMTHKYRVQHLGHHQFPNDPDRDTDFVQLKASGHKLKFPMSRGQFLWECVLKQLLWLPNPIRYAIVRGLFDGTNKDGPYRRVGRRYPHLTIVTIPYLLSLIGGVIALCWAENALGLALVPALLLAGILTIYGLLPERYFTHYVIKSDLSPRFQVCLRVTFYTLLIAALAWLNLWTGKPWWLYYLVLWIIPLGTTFSFFMILRQLVQHGNADGERFSNTRVFQVAWPIAESVFPIGNGYHLPHHLFPMVPHYNLRKLHALLMETDEYRRQAVVTDGYFFPSETPPQRPTVVDLMTTDPK